MYESPIGLFYQETAPKISEGIDSLICEAVLNVGVNVDKEELLKALRYDRGQYEKGYADGIARAERPHGNWFNFNNPLYSGGGYTVCSNCGMRFSFGAYHEVFEFKYCPWCGAQMNGGEDHD